MLIIPGKTEILDLAEPKAYIALRTFIDVYSHNYLEMMYLFIAT